MRHKTFNALETGSRESLLDLSTGLLEAVRQGRSTEDWQMGISDFLIKRAEENVVTPFSCVGPKRGLAVYVAVTLYLALGLKDGESLISHVIATLDDFKPSRHPLITVTRARELLAEVMGMGATKILAYNFLRQPFRVLWVPYQGTYNSTYLFAQNIILCSRVRPEDGASLEEVFLHEVGHAFQCNLTRSPEVVPASFALIHDIFFGGGFSTLQADQATEVFADFFAAAVSHGTSFADTNNLCKRLPTFVLKAFAWYFRTLCSFPVLANDAGGFWTKGRLKQLKRLLPKT